MSKNATTGADGFTDYYSRLFGDEIFRELTKTSLPVLRFNKGSKDGLKKRWADEGFPWKELQWYPYAVEWPAGIPPKTPLPGFREREIYAMNASSLIPVMALQPDEGEIVLDACAAPGGKSMVIADMLDKKGVLLANDLSTFRRNRMRQLFKSYGVSHYEITGYDARLIYKKYPDYFDKILLDAPCSSEKHVYNDPKYLAKWGFSRINRNKERQIQLISSLLMAVKPSGILVYSTCALTPEENEEVLDKIIAKHPEIELISPPALPFADTAFTKVKKWSFDSNKVMRIWPKDNLDPMFVAVIKKTAVLQ